MGPLSDPQKRYDVPNRCFRPHGAHRPHLPGAQAGALGQLLHSAELEYPDGHTSPSVFVAFPVEQLGPAWRRLGDADELAVAIGPPWTLPANLAVAVNGRLDFPALPSSSGGQLIATELVGSLSSWSSSSNHCSRSKAKPSRA